MGARGQGGAPGGGDGDAVTAFFRSEIIAAHRAAGEKDIVQRGRAVDAQRRHGRVDHDPGRGKGVVAEDILIGPVLRPRGQERAVRLKHGQAEDGFPRLSGRGKEAAAQWEVLMDEYYDDSVMSRIYPKAKEP